MSTKQDIASNHQFEHLPKRTQFDKLYQIYTKLSQQNDSQALTYIQQAATIAKELNDNTLIAKSHRGLCKMLKRKGHYKKAIKHGLYAIKMYHPDTDQEEIIKTYNTVAICHSEQEDMEQTIVLLLKALRIIEKQPKSQRVPEVVAGTHLNLAVAYSKSNYQEKALEQSFLSLKISEQHQSIMGIYQGHYTCGNIYLALNEIAKAKMHYFQAFEMAKTANQQYHIAIVYNNLSLLYEKENNLKKALNYAFKSLELKKGIDRQHSLIVSYKKISKIFTTMGKYEQAIHHLNNGLTIAQQMNSFSHQAQLLKKIAEIYTYQNDFKNAYEYHQKFVEMRDQAYDENKAQRLLEMRAFYDLEQKEREAVFHKESAAKIEKYAQQLESSNEDLENFAHVVSHDLKEPLRMVKSYLGLIKRMMPKNTLEKTADFFHYALDGAARMENLITDILALSKISRSRRKFEPTDLNDILFVIMYNLDKLIREKGGLVEYHNLPTLRVDNTQITQLFQNLIGNGIKYNEHSHPKVIVNCIRQAGHYLFSIKDNGIGIPKNQYERVFEMFQRLNSRQKYSGTGIGLAICKKIVERHNGRIWIESEEGKGSTFYFTLPLELAVEEAAVHENEGMLV